jgi:hypothetical protein
VFCVECTFPDKTLGSLWPPLAIRIYDGSLKLDAKALMVIGSLCLISVKGLRWGIGPKEGREEEVGLGKTMSCLFLPRAKPGTLLVIYIYIDIIF